MKIAILSDSSSHLRNEDIKDTNIFLKPLKVTVGQDDFDDTFDNFMQRNLINKIDKNLDVKTSMISPGELENFYDELLKKYDKIYHFPIAMNLSSMYQVSITVAQQEKYNNKVFVFGHYLVAGQLGEFLLKIEELTKKNNLAIDDVHNEINLWSECSYNFVIPSDISRLSKSGRTKSLLYSFLKVLRTKVCIQWAKSPIKFAFSPKLSQIVDKTIKFAIDKFSKKDIKILIQLPIYIDQNDKEIILLLKKFEESEIEFGITDTPSIYIIHAGTRTMGITIVDKKIQSNRAKKQYIYLKK